MATPNSGVEGVLSPFSSDPQTNARATGDALAVIAVSQGFFGFGPGLRQFDEAMAVAQSGGASRFAVDTGRAFAAMDSAALSAMVLGNLGISAATLGGSDPGASYGVLHAR